MKRDQLILPIACAWILLLIVGSLQPARPAPMAGLHLGIHWLAFAVLSLLLLILSRTRRQEVFGVVAACLLGLSLEYLQHLIYRNPMEWHDVRDDSLAVLAAFALYRLAAFGKAVLTRNA